jgi:hypothetical protein
MLKEILVVIGLMSPTPTAPLVDLSKLSPSFINPAPKLAGKYEFLGSADKGSAEFDGFPPPGIVKVYYGPNIGPSGEKMEHTRVGFFRVSAWDWEDFKRAEAAWDARTSWGPYGCIGDYPIAETIVIPDITPESRAQTSQFFRALRMPAGDRDGHQ